MRGLGVDSIACVVFVVEMFIKYVKPKPMVDPKRGAAAFLSYF